MAVIQVLLAVSAIYCGGMWLFLAQHSIRKGADVEVETFHLGLCFILSVGFLGLLIDGGV